MSVKEGAIGIHFEVRESSTITNPILMTSVQHVVSFLVPSTSQHSDCIWALDSELFILRFPLRRLTYWVDYLEEERDIDEMQIL